MRPLSDETTRLIRHFFPEQAEEVVKLIERRCNDDLPNVGKPTAENTNVERIRYGALKLSNGDLQKLQKILGFDWRDILVWAGFGNSLSEHRRWAAEILRN